MIYENIDRGMYDLSNDRSGIRVGNEQLPISKPDQTPAGGGNTDKVKIGQRAEKKEGGGCCS